MANDPMNMKQGMLGTSSHCKKHPKHKQSPGVCSVCLNERLSKIPSRTLRTYDTVHSSSCSSSNLSSVSSVSSDASPAHRFSIESKGRSMSFLHRPQGKSMAMLKKSTSMVFEFDHRKGDGGQVIIGSDNGSSKKKDKKRSFWSKLLRAKTSKRFGSFHDHERKISQCVV